MVYYYHKQASNMAVEGEKKSDNEGLQTVYVILVLAFYLYCSTHGFTKFDVFTKITVQMIGELRVL